jgi:transcription termination factor Rho
MADLADLHLSDLHQRAAELGVPSYRMLRRDQLLEAIGGEPAATEAAEAAEPPEADEAPEGPTEQVSGVLDLMPQRFGFLRLQGLEAADGDVYISASQIRRCELRPGDEISGPAREPQRGERHRALVRVETVNGAEPGAERREFDSLTAVTPRRRLQIPPAVPEAGGEEAQTLLRAVDLLAPLALGQRVLVASPPRSGRTTLLRAMGHALQANEAIELTVLLVDERPEEATRWREELPGARMAIATADTTPAEQGRIAALALAHARRVAEAGADAVLLVDSLSRLAGSRRDGADPKRLFGSGRELGEGEGGSLTVIATVLGGESDRARAAVETTENALITLDPELAAQGVFPALNVAGTRVSNEDEIRDPAELEPARRLRAMLSERSPRDAAQQLRELIEGSATNAELLGQLSA